MSSTHSTRSRVTFPVAPLACPLCGHTGSFEANGLARTHEDFTVTCVDCGAQFQPRMRSLRPVRS